MRDCKCGLGYFCKSCLRAQLAEALATGSEQGKRLADAGIRILGLEAQLAEAKRALAKLDVVTCDTSVEPVAETLKSQHMPATYGLEALAEGLEKAAAIARYWKAMPMRNDAYKAACNDIETSCLATAIRIRLGEYENPTSSAGGDSEKDSKL